MKKILLITMFYTCFTSYLYAEETISGTVTANDNTTTTNKSVTDSSYNDNLSSNITLPAVEKDTSNKTKKQIDNNTDNTTAGKSESNDSALLAEQVDGEEKKYNKYISINASYYMPSGGKEFFNSNFSLGFQFGYFFFDYLGIEVGVSSQIKSKTTKYDIKAYLVGQYELTKFNNYPLNVYASVGPVYSNLSLSSDFAEASKSESSFNIGAKAGLRITIAKRYNIGAIVEYIGAKFLNKDFSAFTAGAEIGVLF